MVNDRDISVDNCLITLNGSYSSEYSGICLANSENVNFTNVIVKNNYYTGIDIEDCSDITFTSCQSYDDRETPLQWYGLELYETNKDISLFNCKLSPNSKGEIYNPNGAVVTIITEKKGASPSVIVRE
jgi:parallel beta-helix repeat protein